MAFCAQCGQPLAEGAKFCSNCGASTGPVVKASVPIPPKPAPVLPANPTPKLNGCTGCLGIIGIGIVLIITVALCSGPSNNSTSPTSGGGTSPQRSEPTPTPESIQQQKKDFLANVDESISGVMIAGSPYKYVGDDVDLHCTVMNIPDPSFFNAECGTDDDGLPAIIVVQYDDTRDLSKGQAVRVMGEVQDPMQGTNAMGGSMNFPTVKAQFME